MTQQRSGIDADAFDEAAAKLELRDQFINFTRPGASVPAAQCVGALGQLGSARVVGAETGEGALHADEVAVRVAVIVEPVGIDETVRVIVWLAQDGFEERSS